MIEPHILVELPGSMIDEIQFEIPEAGIDLVTHFLRKSAIRFCELSHYWQEDCEPITIESGASNYFIDTGYHAKKIVSIANVVDDEGNIFERSESGGVDYFYWQDSPDSIRFGSSQEIDGRVITITAAVAPIQTADQGEEFLISKNVLDNYHDALINGAKHYLYSTPRKDWTDLQLGAHLESKFAQAALSAMRHRTNSFSRLNGKPPRKTRTYF